MKLGCVVDPKEPPLSVKYVCLICDYLHLPPEIVPSTLKRQAPRETRPRASAAPRAGGDKGEGDRAAYRRAPGAGETDKAGAAGPGSAPMEFRGGFGRGKPAQ